MSKQHWWNMFTESELDIANDLSNVMRSWGCQDTFEIGSATTAFVKLAVSDERKLAKSHSLANQCAIVRRQRPLDIHLYEGLVSQPWEMKYTLWTPERSRRRAVNAEYLSSDRFPCKRIVSEMRVWRAMHCITNAKVRLSAIRRGTRQRFCQLPPGWTRCSIKLSAFRKVTLNWRNIPPSAVQSLLLLNAGMKCSSKAGVTECWPTEKGRNIANPKGPAVLFKILSRKFVLKLATRSNVILTPGRNMILARSHHLSLRRQWSKTEHGLWILQTNLKESWASTSFKWIVDFASLDSTKQHGVSFRFGTEGSALGQKKRGDVSTLNARRVSRP